MSFLRKIDVKKKYLRRAEFISMATMIIGLIMTMFSMSKEDSLLMGQIGLVIMVGGMVMIGLVIVLLYKK